MAEWKTYKLRDVVQFNPTERIAKGTLAKKVSMDKLIPYCREVSGYNLESFTGGMKFRNGDTIMARITPCLENGKTSYVSFLEENEIGFGSTEYIVFRAIKDVTDSKFIYYFVTNPTFRSIAIKSMVGSSGRQRVQQSVLEELEISLPSLEEQRRIAGILSAIDDKIENNRRINDNLEQQAQALYKQWFVDFDFPNEEGEPYKSSGGKMVDSELGQIPEGWSVGDIYKYVNVVYGAPYKSVLFNERKDGNPLIRIRDLKTFSPQYYTQEILPNTEYVNAGDVVAGMDAEFVPCLWMGEKGVLNQRCCKFVGKQDSISNYYVMFLVKSELEFVQSYKTGTTVSHLGKADIDKFIVVQPPFAVIEKFSKIADALLNNKIKLAKENITLATLRDTLLPKLMNGEIKL